MTGPLERARAGDPGAFIDLARVHDAELRRRGADDEALLRAYVGAYRAIADYRGEPPPGEWLARFVADRGSTRASRPGPDFWRRLAAALSAEAPALAAPRLPERRFPVLPRLQRRRRGKGPG